MKDEEDVRCWMLDAIAFKKKIYHFSFVILDCHWKKLDRALFSNGKSKITNEK
jgi:hypothetical protein